MEIMELKGHPFYVAVQYHPEYLSRPMRPSPPYTGLILAATGKLNAFLEKGSQKQDSKDHADESSSDEDDDEHLAELVKTTFHLVDGKNCSGSTSSVGSSYSGNTSPKQL